MLRQTFNTKVTSPINRDLTSSAVNDRAYKRDDYSDYTNKN